MAAVKSPEGSCVLDILTRNAALPDGRAGIDVACAGGKIVVVERNVTAEAGRVIDAKQRLVSPPFVDCHFHMDATLSLGMPRLNHGPSMSFDYPISFRLAPYQRAFRR